MVENSCQKFTHSPIEILEFSGRSPVRNSWYEAYKNANLMWAQKGNGMKIALLNAIVQDPPRSGSDFIASRLSHFQANNYADTMDIVHTARGISLPPETLLEGKVPRMHRLWRWGKEAVGHAVAGYEHGQEACKKEPVTTEMMVTGIDRFFDNTLNSAQGGDLRAMIQEAATLMQRGPKMKAEAAMHRMRYDRTIPVREKFDRMRQYCQDHGIIYGGLHDIYASGAEIYTKYQLMEKYPPDMVALLGL